MDFDMDDESDMDELELEKHKKYLPGKRANDSDESDVEVFGFDQDEDSDSKDSFESDMDVKRQDDFDLPDKKAWGKKKKSYYHTDYVDDDYDTITEKKLEAAKLEEEEALDAQKRLAEQLDEGDFGLEALDEKKEDFELDKDEENIEVNFENLSEKQKLELLEKESPEFGLLVGDFNTCFDELKEVLNPLMNQLNMSDATKRALDYIKLKSNIILNYCMNIVFYLVLKSYRERTDKHPIIKTLIKYRELLGHLESNEDEILAEVKESLKSADVVLEKLGKIQKKMVMITKKPRVTTGEIKKGVDNLDENSMEEENEQGEEVDETEDKRAITYTMAKNKGLKPYRKAELRNPRVKHRNKYRKAKIRRKGAIREVRKETQRYGGEISGINATVKKCVKIKS